HAGNVAHLAGYAVCGMRIGWENLDVHRVGSIAGIVGSLIDANREPSTDGSEHVAVDTEEKWLRHVGVAHATDQGASACAIEGQNSQQVLEAARDAIGGVVFL